MDGDGVPLVESAKVREADAWVEKHVIAPAVFYASAFSAQAAGGFVALKPGERKAVLLRVLQIERLERLAGRARDRAAAARGEVAVLQGRIVTEPAHAKGLPGKLLAEKELAEAEQRAAELGERAAAARLALDRARAAAEDAARTADLKRQRAAVWRRLQDEREELRLTRARLENNRAVLKREAEIRDAVLRDAELVLKLETLTETDRGLEAEVKALAASHKEHAAEVVRQGAAAHQAEQRAARARGRLLDREKVLAAQAQIEGLREARAAADAECTLLEHKIRSTQEQQLGVADRRIVGLRSALISIGDAGGDDLPGEARAALEADDAEVDGAQRAPAELAALRVDYDVARARLRDAQAKHDAAERLAARVQDIEAAQAELVDAESAIAAAGVARDAASAAAEEVLGMQRVHIEERDRLRAQSAAVAEERTRLAEPISLLPPLERAAARIEELEPQEKREAERVGATELELAELPDLEAEDVDIAGLEQAVVTAEREEREAHDETGQARFALEEYERGLERVAKLQAELSAKEQMVSDWTRLAQDLGRDGLQALEIDASIPELNEIANDLLHACHGSRFTVTLATQMLNASGKREIEGLYVRVLDTQPTGGGPGRDDLLETFSGGEKVIIAEAVALALTTVACRRAGLDRPTIVRDESGAALDQANGRAYIAMLRRAATLIGADKVFFVTHTPELWELADAWLHVSDGTARVLAEPPSVAAPPREAPSPLEILERTAANLAAAGFSTEAIQEQVQLKMEELGLEG